MNEIRKVVSTLWYDKDNYHTLRNVFPNAEFVYVDFYDKEKLEQEAKDADVALVLGDVPDCLLGENSLKWIACDHAGLNGSARPEVFAKNIFVTGAAGRSAPVLAEHCIYFMLQSCYHTKELLTAQEKVNGVLTDRTNGVVCTEEKSLYWVWVITVVCLPTACRLLAWKSMPMTNIQSKDMITFLTNTAV